MIVLLYTLSMQRVVRIILFSVYLITTNYLFGECSTLWRCHRHTLPMRCRPAQLWLGMGHVICSCMHVCTYVLVGMSYRYTGCLMPAISSLMDLPHVH